MMRFSAVQCATCPHHHPLWHAVLSRVACTHGRQGNGYEQTEHASVYRREGLGTPWSPSPPAPLPHAGEGRPEPRARAFQCSRSCVRSYILLFCPPLNAHAGEGRPEPRARAFQCSRSCVRSYFLSAPKPARGRGKTSDAPLSAKAGMPSGSALLRLAQNLKRHTLPFPGSARLRRAHATQLHALPPYADRDPPAPSGGGLG